MINTIQNTWTWNHKLLIVTISFAVALVIQSGIIKLPSLEASTVTYTASSTVPYSLEEHIEKRAEELYHANKPFDMENYRLEAIREINKSLQGMTTSSPYIDYKDLHEQYGS